MGDGAGGAAGADVNAGARVGDRVAGRGVGRHGVVVGLGAAAGGVGCGDTLSSGGVVPPPSLLKDVVVVFCCAKTDSIRSVNNRRKLAQATCSSPMGQGNCRLGLRRWLLRPSRSAGSSSNCFVFSLILLLLL